ncbi:NAD-glutamate dehydrogenase domain-containing protein [Erythrobacter sp. HL-111]|uniref:NAD-glutamate dehydrogenase n=1 Tax=Erythrobacter sp. HL-111 TaxID=1798193 RepID=UPI0006D95B22|nr:NAD-glutamate dehydrogenase domain-containing protein [Erythrobacter sp. HL-111]KPP88352.1 MAG: glutamate dehydrogenase [Erythrobacteraceae bacterium HL-111]SDS81577.1 glutamate dehydrogenase [Erythrobacter sp. HL-111]
MSTSPAGTRANSAPSDLARVLAGRLGASVLPGDTPLEGGELDEAAAFLLGTAAEREPERAAICIESATNGRRRLRIAIVNDDMPFLVDSIAATLTAQGVSIDRLVHPVIAVERASDGTLTGLDGAGAGHKESFVYIETPRVDARHRRDLLAELRRTLGDVRAAVGDWRAMQAAIRADAERIARGESGSGPSHHEATDLLHWLNRGMLTQLGHLTRHRDGSEDEVLGICRASAREILAEMSYERAFAWFDEGDAAGEPRPLLVIKANRLSNVHRPAPLDLFIVPRREDGKVAAISIHAGVWTSAALASPPQDVPVLRASLARVTEELGFDPAGHAGKSLVHAFTTLPHDLMVAFRHEDVFRLTTAMMSLMDRPRPRLVLVPSPLARHVFAFVWLPRDTISTDVRTRIQALLTQEPGTALLDWSLKVEGSQLALMQFLLDTRASRNPPDAAAIEANLEDLLRGWGDAVETHLAESEEPGRAPAIAARYAPAFPPGYRSDYGPAEAARDIARLRALTAEDDTAIDQPLRDVRLYRLETDLPGSLRLKIYYTRGQLALSDAVPALENFGFRVVTEIPTMLAGGALGTIHDFTLDLPAGADAADLLARCDAIEAAIAEVLNGRAENDAFNRLVMGTALSAREANWLRAIYRYLRQTGMGFTIYTVVDALEAAPDVTRAMIDLFLARHDPAFAGDRKEACEEADRVFAAGLAKVSAINDDRLLRLYRAVIDACLRTNAFAPAAEAALAFKIDSALVPNLPRPLPWREVFVYSARVEGIHLRAGPVARGGLRWSDRRDDFRTEILGLMKAQKVKNAVIVPTGAKGGFYPKCLPSPVNDREGWAAEGQAAYEIFIRTLLSVTDNIEDGDVVHPSQVVITDGEDPYFVVAADKGTARFSDVANGIAQARDFWLDDAFASGGSNGYDHKAMGITARGGWVSVQRHFLEMGIDVQSDPVRVAGCGDMSGDVFGNGMLLSKAIKLVAAFDHRHIFLDPDPDPAASWAERQRLFDLPRSSWDDYDRTLISGGGGVFSRDLKRIALTDEVRAMLGLEEAEIEPDALISAILKAEVDLIWFGGIGTYIKAANENHITVGDPANDALRVDASDVRAKVIGEGANLGATQAGRIEFALGGGRINTDFIDNSAGVDCSDNEVNIKIALAAAMKAGRLTREERNALLGEMTDEVAGIVLEDNRLQALAISVAEAAGPDQTASYVRLIERLEELGDFDRRTQGLADGETLIRRASDGQGLTRPELAVLLSSTKLALQDAIEASDLPDDPALEDTLIAMFPRPMQERFAEEIRTHRLRRELIATEIANRMVNRLGLLVAFELAEEEGASLGAIAKAFVAVDRLFGCTALWERLDTAEVSEATRLMLFDRTAHALRAQMADLLRAGAARQSASELARELEPGVRALTEATGTVLVGEARQRAERMRAELEGAGADEDLALAVVHLFAMDGAVGLARLARKTGVAVLDLTEAFTGLGMRLGLDWAQGMAALMEPSDVWERLLVAGLARDFQQMRLDFLRRLVRRKNGADGIVAAVESWADDNTAAIRRFRSVVERAQAHPPVSPAILAQIASQARNLLDP